MISIIYTTVSNLEAAKKLANNLVAEQLAACVQIDGPITSIYSWKGKIEKEEEYRLTIKCLTDQYIEIESFIKHHHPYETPEIISVPAQAVSEEYKKWIIEETKIRKG